MDASPYVIVRDPVIETKTVWEQAGIYTAGIEHDANFVHQFVVLIEQGLKPRHLLLDVGAGCLGVGRKLITYLCPMHYWAIEPEGWLIKASSVPLPAYHLDTFTDFRLTRIKQKFDFVLAHSIFTHADRATIRTILAETRLVLADGGKFCASFYDQFYGDSEHEGWLYPAGVSYTAEFIQGLAEEAGFEVTMVIDIRHPAKHTWMFAE